MISVIVPVYNCALYLDKGIRSLIDQTIFEDLEIIFVNDGSNDKSADIIQSYTEKYPNMRLINQVNQGVSSARNRGIDAASGDYITFFDADDKAEPILYEKLLRMIKDNNADLSCINYKKYFQDGAVKIQKEAVCKTYDTEEIMKIFFLSNVLCNNTFDKLFNLSIVGTQRFPEGYAIGEDMYFVYMYLLKSKKIAVDTSECLYQYYIRNNSAMKSRFSEKYFDSVNLSKAMMNFVPNNSHNYLLTEANWIHEICKTLALYYQDTSDKYYPQIDEYEKSIKNYSLVKAYKYLSKKHFIALLLMRLSPKLYIKIYEYLHVG